MKPEDILNAIGNVEDRYVKKAHGKDLVKALAWFFGTLTVLLIITGNMMEPDYILSRINPDFTVNTGYVEPEHLEKDRWTSMEYTAYENGEEKGRTVFRRTLYDHYTVTNIPVEGERTVLVGRAGISAREYVGKKDISAFYMETYYSEDLIGRIDSMAIGSRFAHETPYEMLNYLKIEYFDSILTKQTRYSGKEDTLPVGWRTYSTGIRGVVQTKDYDAQGKLVGYTDYTYDGSCRRGESYTAEGVLTGSTMSHYDWMGRLRKQERYDAEGNLTGREVYRYRFWERYGSPEGLFTLFACISLSATLGIASWEERLRVPQKRKSRSDLARELKTVRTALEQAAQEELTDREREALAGELKAIRRALEKLENRRDGI